MKIKKILKLGLLFAAAGVLSGCNDGNTTNMAPTVVSASPMIVVQSHPEYFRDQDYVCRYHGGVLTYVAYGSQVICHDNFYPNPWWGIVVASSFEPHYRTRFQHTYIHHSVTHTVSRTTIHKTISNNKVKSSKSKINLSKSYKKPKYTSRNTVRRTTTYRRTSYHSSRSRSSSRRR